MTQVIHLLASTNHKTPNLWSGEAAGGRAPTGVGDDNRGGGGRAKQNAATEEWDEEDIRRRRCPYGERFYFALGTLL
jgi:hypothetical protein